MRRARAEKQTALPLGSALGVTRPRPAVLVDKIKVERRSLSCGALDPLQARCGLW